MATANNWASFSRNLKLRSESIAKNSERRIIEAAVAASDVAIEVTPFKTGKAKAGWLASFGTTETINPEPPVSGNADASEGLAKNRNRATLFGWRRGRGSIYLSNGVPYIGRLENGSSTQAPHGMTKQALQAARAVLAQHTVLRNR